MPNSRRRHEEHCTCAAPAAVHRGDVVTSTHVKHPILRLEILAADGTSAEECRVFCRLQRKSVRVEDCCSCVHCDAITDGTSGAPSVNCTIPVSPHTAAHDPTGDSTEVATVLCTGTVVVSASANLSVAFALLRAEDRRAVAIVDKNHVLVGLVHETAFIGLRTGAHHGPIGGAMSTAMALHEGTPVRAALRLLAASHLREATVVSGEGTPIGVFKDVDGLRWIAREQRSSNSNDDARPRPETRYVNCTDEGREPEKS